MSYNRWNPRYYDLELYHHGVKGMHWGVRKQSYSSDRRLRSWEKRYNREQRKLIRLQDRADMNLQKKQADLYSQRSAKATKVAIRAGITAATSLVGNVVTNGVNDYLRNKALAKLNALNEDYDKLMDYAYDKFSELCKNDRQAYTPDGKWTGKGYSKEFDKAVDALQDEVHQRSDAISRDMKGITTKYNATARVLKIIAGATGLTTQAAVGVAGVSAGYAIYNKIQAKHARDRLTTEGHKKAKADVAEQQKKLESLLKEREDLLKQIKQEKRLSS